MCDIDRPCISPPPVAIRRRPPKPLPWPVWLAEKSLTGVFRLRDLCPRPIRSFLWAAIEPAARFLFTDFIYRPALLPLTRFLFPLRCWIGRTLYKKTPETFQIDPWTWVKWGPGVSEEEAETMRFVAQHSAGQVPVPQVFDAFNRASISNQWIKCHLGLPKPEPLHCILMAHVPGLPMPWALKNSSEECMTTFTDDISRICKAIRRLTPTGAMIGNIRAGPCLDWRVFPGE